MGVAMGALSPNFAAENPLQVGLSLGGFAYMAAALAYVGAIMLLMAKPVVRFAMRALFGAATQSALLDFLPLVTAVTLSIALCVFPLLVAEKRLESRDSPSTV
jgi:ABC-2 type transport system permease protein